MFDVTFLTSPWRCIYGHGCQGVLTGPAPELEQGCCSYGAHFVDEDDANAVLEAADRLTDRAVAAPAGWRCGAGGPIRRTAKGTLRHPARRRRLHLPQPAGLPGRRRLRPAPRRRSRPASDRSTGSPTCAGSSRCAWSRRTDESGHVTSTLREWKRRDWGAGGQEFHWWCTEAPDAFVGATPVYVALRDEIVEMVGEWAYDRFVEHVSARNGRQPRGQQLRSPPGAAPPLSRFVADDCGAVVVVVGVGHAPRGMLVARARPRTRGRAHRPPDRRWR